MFLTLLNTGMITATVIFGCAVVIIDHDIAKPLVNPHAPIVASPDGFTADGATCAPITPSSPFRV